jgi:hypothetical protein
MFHFCLSINFTHYIFISREREREYTVTINLFFLCVFSGGLFSTLKYVRLMDCWGTVVLKFN